MINNSTKELIDKVLKEDGTVEIPITPIWHISEYLKTKHIDKKNFKASSFNFSATYSGGYVMTGDWNSGKFFFSKE